LRSTSWRGFHFDQAEILLAGEAGFGGFVETGGGDHFQEEFVHLFGGFAVDGAVHTDHAAECGNGVAFECALVGFSKSLAGRTARGVGVLDDGADGGGIRIQARIEFLRKVPGGLQVDDVVVGKFFALKLAGVCHAQAGAIGIHGGLLVRVFTVAQVESFLERQAESLRKCGDSRPRLSCGAKLRSCRRHKIVRVWNTFQR
jgi:hypothetical protein